MPIFCSSTLRDYFGLIFDELFTVFDSRGEFSRLNVFFISTVKKLLQEVYWRQNGDLVLMRMNSTNGLDVGENTLTIYSPNTMTGYGQSWDITNTSTGFYTSSVWTFKGTCT